MPEQLLSVDEWLEKGGEIPSEQADDEAWIANLHKVLSEDSSKAMTVLLDRSMQSQLATVGIGADGLRKGVGKALDQGVDRLTKDLPDKPYVAALARMIRRTFDLTPERAQRAFPFLAPQVVKNGLFDLLEESKRGPANQEPGRLSRIPPGPVLLQVLHRGTFREPTVSTADADLQLAYIASAARSIAAPRQVSLRGRLLLSAAAMDTPDRASNPDWIAQLADLGWTTEKFRADVRRIGEGDAGPLVDASLPRSIEQFLTNQPVWLEFPERLGLPIDLSAARLQQVLDDVARSPGLDPWARMTIDALAARETRLRAEKCVNLAAQKVGLPIDWGAPQSLAPDSLWRRRPHVDHWLLSLGMNGDGHTGNGSAVPEAAVDQALNELSDWASDASPLGHLRVALATTWLTQGPEQASELTQAIGLPESQVEQAVRRFLDGDSAFFSASGEFLSAGIASRLIAISDERLAALIHNSVEKAAELRRVAVADLRAKFTEPEYWLVDLLLLVSDGSAERTGQADGPLSTVRKLLAVRDLRGSLLRGETSTFKTLPMKDKLLLAESAVKLDVDAVAALSEYVDYQIKAIIASPVFTADDRERLHDELAACRDEILGNPPAAGAGQPDALRLDGLRAGNPTPFRQVRIQQDPILPTYRETETTGDRILRHLLSFRGFLLIAVVGMAGYLAWLYLLPSFGPAKGAASANPALPAMFNGSMLGLKATVAGDGTNHWYSDHPVTQAEFERYVRPIKESAAGTTPGPSSTQPALVGSLQAAQWCQLRTEHLKAVYGKNGFPTDTVVRLPTKEEWDALPANTKTETIEWIWDDTPSDLLSRESRASDGKRYPESGDRRAFRFVIGSMPQPSTSRTALSPSEGASKVGRP